MEHLINCPIEAHEMQNTRHHVKDCGGVKLCFFYHRGLAVGYDVEVLLHGTIVKGEVLHCSWIHDDLFKCEVVFLDIVDAFKVRMLEQAAHIERYQKENPEMSMEEAANKWVEINGALFPNK